MLLAEIHKLMLNAGHPVESIRQTADGTFQAILISGSTKRSQAAADSALPGAVRQAAQAMVTAKARAECDCRIAAAIDVPSILCRLMRLSADKEMMAVADHIEALQSRANELAKMDALPADYTEDKYWPAY